jgi:hypothetical protein
MTGARRNSGGCLRDSVQEPWGSLNGRLPVATRPASRLGFNNLPDLARKILA